jgi:hypothetical protein
LYPSYTYKIATANQQEEEAKNILLPIIALLVGFHVPSMPNVPAPIAKEVWDQNEKCQGMAVTTLQEIQLILDGEEYPLLRILAM